MNPVKRLQGIDPRNDATNDYFDLKGKKEKRAKLIKEAEKIVDNSENGYLKGSQSKRFNKIEEQVNDLNLEIKKAENNRSGVVESRSRTYWEDKNGEKIRVLNRNEKFANANPDFSLGQLAQTMVTGKGSPEIKNALSEGTDSAGGFTVPRATLDDFFDRLRAKSRIVQSGAKTIQVETNRTVIGRVSSDPSVAWHQEHEVETDSDVTFEGAIFKPKTLMILVKSSREMISDSLNMGEVLESVFAGTVGTAIDAGILFGSGSNGEIEGLTSRNIAEVAEVGELTNYDPLVKAYKMMLDNNSDAPTSYLMAPREWEKLATLKDSQNRYLDRPQALDGIPFYDTTNVPTDGGTGSNESSIITGNWSDLIIGLRSEMRIELLRERYADSYEFGYLCHMRVDALPARDGSFCKITGITPAP